MPPRKRSQPQPEPASRRKSLRASSGGKKSAYFEDGSEAEDTHPPPRKVARMGRKSAATSTAAARKVAAKARDDESSEDVLQASPGDTDSADDDDDDDDDGGYEDEAEASDDDEEGSNEEEEEEEEEEDVTPPPKKRGRPASTTKSTAAAKGGKKGKAGVGGAKSGAGGKAKRDEDEDEDEDDDEENRITFIPLPQLRDTGGVEYADTRLHGNTMLFLKDLKANNQRNWLKMHDPEYRRSLKDWESFVETLTEKITDADETIPELPLKDVIFRIYRDIRFTKDPTPYKAHYSAAWSRTGRKGPYACYYVHAEPGHCMVGGGLWHPDNESLARLRASIDERPHRIRRVLLDPEFRRTFLSDAEVGGKNKKKQKKTKGKSKNEDAGGDGEQSDDEEKAVLEAFAKANTEGALKTKPKGFHPEHRDIELLKLRNFTIGTQIPDEMLLGDDAQERVMDIIRPMVPFITFLNRTVRPDPGEASDSEDEEEE
ncbi:hypothetical protein F4810DRAFT_475933 [Camillea tinctor]|nr:hypothetical protein F4810DRAFT_475933 [Camillea tinctor]